MIDELGYVEEIRHMFGTLWDMGELVTSSTGVKTLEIVGASFIADEDCIFGKVDVDYVEREKAWYETQVCNVNAMSGKVPKIWQDVAAADGTINSNYGWALFSEENGSQYDRVVEELKSDPTSRRGLAIYTRPSMHVDAFRDGMRDFMCTNTVQYLVRDDELVSIVNMRSNDAVYGYKNDYAWQKHVADKMAADLGVTTGPIVWNAGLVARA